ncbi:ricin-type beta-trefoil lectin domain protein [Kitasatospora sp. NPDC093679]|uniref:ricin-type beta-trefoil lectin domain protein n=1 Tax=Kitasatospora sp. NPDC093679 TaxID=3154983 RepID=UPI003423ABFD
MTQSDPRPAAGPAERPRRAAARLVAGAAAGAIGMALLAAPAASAADAASASPPAPSGTAAAPKLTDTQKSMLDARSRAKASGRATPVESMTNETSTTVANPNGTFTTTDNAKPVRAKRGKAWADLDTRLHRNADGSVAPAVTSSGLTISGGGTGPLATITTTDGKKLAVTAPFALPAPALDGDTATYGNVLPDVDLQLTALPDGGWRDVVVVRTAAAAADPRLKRLHFPVRTTGLSVATDSAGNVTVKDQSGKVRMQAPTPFQWDSARATVLGNSKSARVAGPEGNDPAEPGSSAQGPGANATIGKIGITADSEGFDLVPDAATFGKGQGPWYLDPTISADSWSVMSAQVQEYNPNTKYADSVSNLGVGYCGYSDCTGYGRERIYYRIGINSAIWNIPSGAPKAPTVFDSTFYASVTQASSPSTSTPLGLYWTPGINSGLTWNTQPCNGGGTFGGCSKVGGSTWITGTGPIAFNVTSQMQQAAANHSPDWTVGIAPDDENNKYYRKHLANNPHITTNYDITPSVWWARTIPQPGFASTNQHNDCQTPGGGYAWYNPGWVGANQNIQLAVNDWSPAGLPLYAKFRMWDDNDPNAGQTPSTPKTTAYNTEVVPVGSLADGHQYGWTVNATDDTLMSDETPWCYFRVDKTPPAVGVVSTDFPPSGTPNPNPTKFNTDSGTFTLTGSDPAPGSGLSASGLACFQVKKSPTPVTGWKCGDQDTVTADANGKAAYTTVPGTWGTNALYVQAQDNAGNYSQPAVYSYYAPWNPASNPVFGDVTGDLKPDVTVADGNGNLRVVQPASSDAGAAGVIAGSAAASPTGTWTGVQVTHRSSLRANVPVDDLIAHPAGDARLYLYQNDGHGNFVTRTSFYKSGTTINSAVTCQDVTGAAIPCPVDFGTDWSNATQILALGTPEGEVAGKDANGKYVLTRTSLLAVINKQLWLFPPGTSSARLLKTPDTQVSTADWSNYDLIGPGPANGNNQPTLWTRERTGGVLHAYPITLTGGVPDFGKLVDPAYGPITVPAGNINPTEYPTVGSNGDLTGDGVADLWATAKDGRLVVFPGTSSSGTSSTPVTGVGSPVAVGDLRAPLGHWKLADATGSATAKDETGLRPLAAQGGVAFQADTVAGRSARVAAFNGTDAALVSSDSRLDAKQSFTVTTWAKANAGGGVVASQDGTTASAFKLWAADRGNGVYDWSFGMAASDTANAAIDQTDTANVAARVKFGQWQQLTASYNAATKELLLYVDGALASTGGHSPAFTSTQPLAVGRAKQNGAAASWFSGSVAELSVLQYAAPMETAAATAVLSGTSAGKCLDNDYNTLANGNRVQITDCNSAPAQQWSLNATGTITNQGWCLDAYNNVAADGTKVQLFTCNGGANQQWLPTGNGGFYNPATARCLDVPGGSTTNGTPLQVWTCNGSPAQRWSFGSLRTVLTASLPGS